MKRRAFLSTSLLAGMTPRVLAENEPLTPESPGYDKARQLFNSDLSLRPAFILPCRNERQVAEAIGFANEKDLPVAVKSGGHSFAGFSMNEGGVVIDLSICSQKVYLPQSQRLHAGPGAKLGTLYDVLLPHGRLLPAGSCAGVGLGGLTLGGGYGLFARQYGLTCDHLQRVRMIDGRGQVIDSEDDPDLLWACRGGGNGNFGVVTSMEFMTRPAPRVLGAQRFSASVSTPARAVELMAVWFEMAATLAEPIFSAFILNGKKVTILLTSSYATSGPAFQRAVGSLRKAGFASRGAANSPLARALKRYYGRPGPLPFSNCSGGYYRGMEDLEGVAMQLAAKVAANPGLIFQVNTLGGAIARGPESAYPHRALPFLGEIQSYWNRASQRNKLVGAVKELRVAISEAGVKAHYRNYPDLTLENWEESYYGDSYRKLQGLKIRYDPHDRIRHPQSVRLEEGVLP